MQPDLKSRLEEAAARSGRSMNAEIIARLESSEQGNSALVEALARLNFQLASTELDLAMKSSELQRAQRRLRAVANVFADLKFQGDLEAMLDKFELREDFDPVTELAWSDQMQAAIAKGKAALDELHRLRGLPVPFAKSE